jgi:hypothetical protein
LSQDAGGRTRVHPLTRDAGHAGREVHRAVTRVRRAHLHAGAAAAAAAE